MRITKFCTVRWMFSCVRTLDTSLHDIASLCLWRPMLQEAAALPLVRGSQATQICVQHWQLLKVTRQLCTTATKLCVPISKYQAGKQDATHTATKHPQAADITKRNKEVRKLRRHSKDDGKNYLDRNVAQLLHVFQGTKKASPSAVLQLVTTAHQNLQVLNALSLKQFVWCLSQFMKHNAAAARSPEAVQQLLDPVTKRLAKVGLSSLGPSNLAQLVLDLAHTGYLPSYVCDLVASIIMDHDFKSKSVTKTAWGIAKAGHDPLNGKFFDYVLTQLGASEDLQQVEIRELVQLVWCFPTVGRLDDFKHRPNLWQSITAAFERRMHACVAQDVANFLWAAGRGDLELPVTLLDDVCLLTVERHHEFTRQGFDNVVWGFAKQRYVPRSPPFVDMFTQRFERVACDATTPWHAIAQLVSSAAQLGLPMRAQVLDRWLESLLAQADTLRQYDDPDDAVMVHSCLFGLAVIGHPIGPEALRVLGEYLAYAFARGHLDERNHGQVARVVKSMGQSGRWLQQDVLDAITTPPCLTMKGSGFQVHVRQALVDLGYTFVEEYDVHNHKLDIALLGRGKVAVEVDGPVHFSLNRPYVRMGETVLRNRILESFGWKVVSVPFYEWDNRGKNNRKAYLARLLLEHGDGMYSKYNVVRGHDGTEEVQ